MAEKPTEDRLTAQQQRFVDEYLVDCNGAQAAIRAGYSPKGAPQRAAELLTIRKVATAIEAKRARLQVRTELSTDKVLKEISRVAFSDMRNVARWSEDEVIFKSSDELTDDMAACISEINSTTTFNKDGKKVQMRVKLHDKMRAIEMLSKHLGLLMQDKENGQTLTVTPENIAALCEAARRRDDPKE